MVLLIQPTSRLSDATTQGPGAIFDPGSVKACLQRWEGIWTAGWIPVGDLLLRGYHDDYSSALSDLGYDPGDQGDWLEGIQ